MPHYHVREFYFHRDAMCKWCSDQKLPNWTQCNQHRQARLLPMGQAAFMSNQFVLHNHVDGCVLPALARSPNNSVTHQASRAGLWSKEVTSLLSSILSDPVWNSPLSPWPPYRCQIVSPKQPTLCLVPLTTTPGNDPDQADSHHQYNCMHQSAKSA